MREETSIVDSEQQVSQMAPEVKATSFFMVPDWQAPEGEWRSVMLAFFRAFTPADPVSLLVPYDPGQDSVADIEAVIAAVAAMVGLGLESIPDTVLHPVVREPALLRALARQCSAILVTSARPEEWASGGTNPVLADPTPEGLKAWHSPRQPSDLASYEDPAAYWEWRASDLIHRYNHLDQWQEMHSYHQQEAKLVTDVVRRFGLQDVLVAGCGNGRQFKYLLPEVKHLEGFDLVPEMVQDAQRSFPGVPVHCYALEQLAERARPHEAVLSSTVLQHIKPADLPNILAAMTRKAQRLLIFVELVRLEGQGAAYNFAHDYPTLMQAYPEWRPVCYEHHFQTPQVSSAVMAWERVTPADPLMVRISRLNVEQRQLLEAFLTVLALDSPQPGPDEAGP